MNGRAKKVAQHPVTVGSGVTGGVLGVVILLWQMGVFQHLPGTASEDTAIGTLEAVRMMEPRIRANEVEIAHKADESDLRELRVITNNLVKEAELRASREDDLIAAIRELVELQGDQ